MSEEIDHHTSPHQSGAIRRNGADILAVRVAIRNHAAFQPARRSSMQARLLHERTCPGRVRDTAVVASVFATFLLVAGVSTARADLAGTPASGFLGPAIKTDPDVFPDREQFSHISLGLPGTVGPVVTADTLIAENSGDAESGCTTHVFYENLKIDLNNLPGGGVPLTLSAAVLHTTATARAGGAAGTQVQIVGLAVNGQPVGDVSPAPNTVLLDLSTLGLPDITGSIVLHEQSAIPGGMSANAIRVQVFVVNVLTGVNQAIDLKVAHAEADVH
jgi:hypothetical protein